MNEEDQKRIASIGDMDQAGASLAGLAPVMAQYYRALIHEDLSPDVALQMVLGVQRALFEQGKKQ